MVWHSWKVIHSCRARASDGRSPARFAVIQKKWQADTTNGSYSGRCVWKRESEREKERGWGGGGRSTDSMAIHSRESKQTLHHWHVSQNIIWQRVHFGCIFLCTRKPNRLEEVCCSQTASLPGSDPSAHWLQPRKQSTLTALLVRANTHTNRCRRRLGRRELARGSTDAKTW